jgi:hypothetical protein
MNTLELVKRLNSALALAVEAEVASTFIVLSLLKFELLEVPGVPLAAPPVL